MAEVAAHLSDSVLPAVPMRQWVLSVPKRLRPHLLRDPDLAGAVLRILLRVIRGELLGAIRGPASSDDAFSVESALRIDAFVGTFIPGATVRATVRQMDPATPFEMPVEIALEEPALPGSILSTSAATISATWDIPFTAAAGRHTVAVASSGPDGTVMSRLLPALDLPAPAPSDLPIATPTALAIDEEEGSVVVRITPSAGKLVFVSIENPSPATFQPFQFNLISPDSTFDGGRERAFLAVTTAPWHMAIQAPPGGPYTLEAIADTIDAAITPLALGTPAAGEISPSEDNDLTRSPSPPVRR